MNKLGNYFSDKYLMTSDSIPTEGSFEVGDIVVNTGENISEEPFWICTESGTPGVWQSINVKSTTKMVSFKNKVILTEATNTVNIGIVTDYTIHPKWETTDIDYYVTADEMEDMDRINKRPFVTAHQSNIGIPKNIIYEYMVI